MNLKEERKKWKNGEIIPQFDLQRMFREQEERERQRERDRRRYEREFQN